MYALTYMLALVEVTGGKHRGVTGVKLAKTDTRMQVLPLRGDRALWVGVKNAKQMFDVPGHPQFSHEPSDKQLQELWYFLQTSFDATQHVFHPGCPKRVRQRTPPMSKLRNSYTRQPVLTKAIRVVPCSRTASP